MLLNIGLEGAVRRSFVQRNGTIITRFHMVLDLEDDIDHIGTNPRIVEESFGETTRIGQSINSTITKYMVAGRAIALPHGALGKPSFVHLLVKGEPYLHFLFKL